jgi:hypothetical protein
VSYNWTRNTAPAPVRSGVNIANLEEASANVSRRKAEYDDYIKAQELYEERSKAGPSKLNSEIVSTTKAI